ncbi:uncharacterized protein LOC129565230 isoform X2 [Sitodiplosis mosellana]|uniref:uncharacterized protein LOC129565230 isoform X2 n=1 Tax=Sitodiplosis mosellana TaxID=263140 RepID=UPI002443CF36|nr:uncharacterized protein LOC129565230 isoform X2 [Sitodiplosis mosellana]
MFETLVNMTYLGLIGDALQPCFQSVDSSTDGGEIVCALDCTFSKLKLYDTKYDNGILHNECSKPNSNERNERIYELIGTEILKAIKTGRTDFVRPDSSSSPFMKLVETAAQTCDSKFNMGSNHFAWILIPSPLKWLQEIGSKVCSFHCMFEELKIIDGNELTNGLQRWLLERGVSADHIQEANNQIKAFKDNYEKTCKSH